MTGFKKIALMVAAMVSVSTPALARGADGYNFTSKQFEKKEVTISIVTYRTQAALGTAARIEMLHHKQAPTDTDGIFAFSVLEGPNYDHCTIHMVDPAIKYDTEASGAIAHEFLHCFFGQWHNNNSEIPFVDGPPGKDMLTGAEAPPGANGSKEHTN